MPTIRFLFQALSKQTLDKLRPLTDEDRRALAAHEIHSAEDFHAKMAQDPLLLDTLGLADAAARTRVAETMAAVAGKRARAITGSPLAKHVFDIVVVMAVLAAAYSLFLRDRTPRPPRMAQQVVVTAASGLRPFHVITRSDVGLRNTHASAGTVASVEDVLGRYVDEQLPEGTVLQRAKLNSGPALSVELDGLRVLAVKLQPSPLLVNLKPPVRLGIMPAPHERYTAEQPALHDVYVLSTRPLSDGVSAVIAVPEAHARHLALFIGRAQLIAVGPVR